MSTPNWKIVSFISLGLSTIISGIQASLEKSSVDVKKLIPVAFCVSLAEFYIATKIINIMNPKPQGFDGIGESILNVFIINPLIILLTNKLLISKLKK